ncbi:MAG: hypothetical protein IT168_00500 [Bryobacterales bacterium]|nr:hypothetical protein [Bryobacterales bacterium]
MRVLLGVGALVAALNLSGASIDLRQAVVVVRLGQLPPAESTAAKVLVEEIKKRTGIELAVSKSFPSGRPAIAITSTRTVPEWNRTVPAPPAKAEGFRLHADHSTVWLAGSDARGALYAVGQLLRQLDWDQGKLELTQPLDISTAPQSSIRGHQLGYRSTANSWDAWTVQQFEQYIRELAFFGINAIENIPAEDNRKNPLMKYSRREMNKAMGEICARYGIDYWLWTPAPFDLTDTEKRADLLRRMDQLFDDVPQIGGIFFPGGDPGDNPPDLVLGFLEELATHMRRSHKETKIWLSLQGFSKEKAEAVYSYLDKRVPEWFGGIVHGPSSPSITATRRRLRADVKLRLYPDVTHNKISQYEVPEWDQAYALTLGREAVNPRPYEYAAIHNRYAALSDGFLSYSDGVHDDVNKTVWSALAWDRSRDPRQIVIEYARVFFSPAIGEQAADGILALERNWRGPLPANGGVEATLSYWRQLEAKAPWLDRNWRWQMCLLRATYDTYVRRRLLQDTKLENEANSILARSTPTTAVTSMDEAMRVLNQAVESPAGADLRARIIELCAKLFESIGLQTSVAKYHASGAERGAVLDFIDNPLNNRWWLEDEFAKVRKMTSGDEQARRLHEIAAWENPGPGSFYDDIGNIRKSPHMVRGTGPDADDPLYWWWDNGKSRARLSWQVTMWPQEMRYEGLDPMGRYVVRTTGYGQALLRAGGQRLKPSVDGKELGEFKDFPIPPSAVTDGTLVLTWDKATDEDHLNWRKRSRLSEVWVLKQ